MNDDDIRKSAWKDYDDCYYVNLAGANADPDVMERVVVRVTERLFPGRPYEGHEHVKLARGHTSTVVIRLDTWLGLGPEKRKEIEAFLDGALAMVDR